MNTWRFLSNRLHMSLVCFGVNEAREVIRGDLQLSRRFKQFTLSRWAAHEQFETLIVSILRNTPMGRPFLPTSPAACRKEACILLQRKPRNRLRSMQSPANFSREGSRGRPI